MEMQYDESREFELMCGFVFQEGRLSVDAVTTRKMVSDRHTYGGAEYNIKSVVFRRLLSIDWSPPVTITFSDSDTKWAQLYSGIPLCKSLICLAFYKFLYQLTQGFLDVF